MRHAALGPVALTGGALAGIRAAEAHEPASGLAGLVEGATVALSPPPMLLAVLALALLMGRSGAVRAAPVALLVSALAAGAGAAGAGTGLSGAIPPPSALYALALVAGLAAAAGRDDLAPLPAALTLVLGAAAGFGSMPEHGAFAARAAHVAGTALAVPLALAVLATLAAALSRAGAAIAVRVGGAWIAAIAVLMLTLRLSGGGGAAV